MHRFYEDRFGAIEFGVRHTTYGIIPVGDGGSGARTNKPAAAPKPKKSPEPKPEPTPVAPEDKRIHTRTTEVDGRTKTVPVSPTDQVKEAIKDGAINDKEKTAFDKRPSTTGSIVTSEQDRLRKALIAAQGADVERDSSGRVKLEDGKLVLDPGQVVKPTTHEKLVERLAETVGDESLDQIDARIAELKSSGSDVGLSALQGMRATRASEEAKVVDVVKDKLGLIGTLEAQKLTETTEDPSAELESLRARADDAIEELNANGGRTWDDGTWGFGEGWEDKDASFDQLEKLFDADPDKLKDFAGSQGKEDGDLRGKSLDEVDDYLSNLDDSGEALKIAQRYNAAAELTEIFTEYDKAEEAAKSAENQSAALDAEISYVTESMEQDLVGLSGETLDSIERHITPIDGIIESNVVDATKSSDKGDKADKVGGGQGEKADGGAKGGKADGDAKGGNADGGAHPTTGGDDSKEIRGDVVDVKIDYTEKERSAQVLTQAQKQNLLPSANVEFNDKGQAVYTVQPNDSYWRIADQSDGKGSAAFDPQHFTKLVTTNSERLGRDPQVGLIHPNEQVIIQDRTLEQLVKLLELPATEEQVSAGVPPHMQRPGGMTAY